MATKSLDRPVFLRPVEITSSNNTVTVDSVAYNIPVGIYATVLHVMRELDTQLGGSYDFRVFPAAENEFRSRISNTSTMSVTWTDPDLANLLGFATTTLSGSTLYTSPEAPQYAWVPNFVPAKRDAWGIDQRKAIKGTNTVGGNYVGVKATDDKYVRDFDFVHELASNVLRTHCVDAIAQTKTFEHFALKARSAVASLSTGVSVKGFYLVYEISSAYSTRSWVGSTDSGGINSEFTTGADEYVFCAFHGDRIRIGNYTLPKGFERMSLKFSAITANAPVWA